MRFVYVRAVCLSAAMVLVIMASTAAAQSKSARRGSAETEAILPQIDVIRVKESSDEALRTANELKREIAALNAKLTVLDNRMLLLSEEVSRVSTAKIEELETRLALLTEAYKDMHIMLQSLESYVRPAPKPAPKPNTATFTTTASGDLVLSSPEYDLYQSGLRFFNSRSYEKAIAMFADCLSKFPDGEYKDRARYWIGECHYQLGNMEQAIEEYKKVFSYQNSTKADAAQFQIALAYQKLGQIERSRAEFRRLVERYPASSYVERSKKYLADLK